MKISPKILLSLILAIACLLGRPDSVFPQENKDVSKRLQKQFNQALELYNSLEWERAVILLQEITSRSPGYLKAWLLLGELALRIYDNDLAYKAFRQVADIDSLSYPGVMPELARLAYLKGEYSEAQEILQKTGLEHPDKKFRLEERVNFALNQINEGRENMQPYPIGINSDDHEYFPSLTIDGRILVFTRQGRVGNEKEAPGQEDLYESHYDGSAFSKPVLFPEPVTTPGNEGTQSVRQDGRLMFFTACSRPDSKGGCDIYISQKRGEEWNMPLNVGYPINTRYWESTPFLTLDGRKLYFASSRPGGYGGMDIWISSWDHETGWTEPVNAGPSINTWGDELAPYVHGDGSIYFSSSGWIGMGGLDLFVVRFSGDSICSEPVNLGYPVNTHHEELGIGFSSTGNFVLFSSNRDTAAGRDIYRANLPEKISPARLAVVRGSVSNKISGEPVSASVIIQDQKGGLVSGVDSDPSSGSYLIGLPVGKDHRFSVNREGFLFYSAYLPADSLDPGEIFEMDILLEPIVAGSKTILRNLFFETDSFSIKKESFPELLELVELLKQNPGTQIEIGGHTDNTGNYDYNISLSRARAESVRQFLADRGISPDRLSAVGYGSDQPIAENDTDNGKAKNRRTEIRIMRLNPPFPD